MKRFILLFAVTILGAGSLMAQKSGWTLDRAHSSIGFSVRHMVISEVTGNFKDFDITFSSSKGDYWTPPSLHQSRWPASTRTMNAVMDT